MGSAKTGEISKSAISPRGRSESLQLGIQAPEFSEQTDIGWSGNIRTLETIKGLIEGGQVDGVDFKAQERIELSEKLMPKDWIRLYVAKWDANKAKILAEMGISKKRYPLLSTSEQAEIAETAEEPVIAEWLDNQNSELAKLYPSETAAAHMAVLVKEDIEKPANLESGSKLDQLRGTHKTITEPLLMKILRLENGQKPQKLEDIGDCLSLNDGFEIDSSIDEKGEKSLKFTMYRAVKTEPGEGITFIKKEFGVDLDELNRLADLGVKLEKEREQKSDDKKV